MPAGPPKPGGITGVAPRRRFDGCSPVVVVLLGVVAVAVVWPAAYAIVGVVRGVLDGGGAELAIGRARGASLARTVAWSVGVGAAAAIAAWPVAWVLRSARAWWAPILLAPMLLPNYLAYAGWNLLRAPRTVLGDAVERALQHDLTWIPIALGRGLAGLGLVLWVWPVAALVLAISLRRVDRAVLDSLALEPVPWWRRAVFIVSATRWGWATAAGVAALLTLASPVPLHVANVPTYAVEVVWASLDLHMFAERWRAWASAWPLVVIAVVVGALLAGPAARGAAVRLGEDSVDAPPRSSAVCRVAACVVWGAGVLVPLWLLARDAGSLRVFANTARTIAPAAASSAVWALLAGAVAVVIAASAAALAASRRRLDRAAVVLALGALLASGLTPGVLIGSAVGAAVGAVPLLGGSLGAVAVGEVARFGFLGALAGCVLAQLEAPQVADLRRLDGAVGVRGWVATALPVQGGALAGVGLATFALAFHEVEAAAQLQPPGLGGLATLMLNFLHFARQTDLSAASVMLIVGGLAVGMSALGLAWGSARRTRRTFSR